MPEPLLRRGALLVHHVTGSDTPPPAPTWYQPTGRRDLKHEREIKGRLDSEGHSVLACLEGRALVAGLRVYLAVNPRKHGGDKEPLAKRLDFAHALLQRRRCARHAVGETSCAHHAVGETRIGDPWTDVELDSILLAAAAESGATDESILAVAGAAFRRIEASAVDVRTVLPPQTLSGLMDIGVIPTRELPGDDNACGRHTAAAALFAGSGAASAIATPHDRRPEAPHGCVIVDQAGNVLGSGRNHTLTSVTQLAPQLRTALPVLKGLCGDHRQWQMAWERRVLGASAVTAGGDGTNVNDQGRPTQRLSLHAEQHAILEAAAAGKSVTGGDCYVAQLDRGLYAEAYPCTVCLPLLRDAQIARIFFTTPTGTRLLALRGIDHNSRDGPGRVRAAAASACGDVSDAMHWGTIKTTQLKKFGFIIPHSDGFATAEDVYFKVSSVQLPASDAENPYLRRFPNGTPMLHQPFREYLAGKRVKYKIAEQATSGSGLRAEATLVVVTNDGTVQTH